VSTILGTGEYRYVSHSVWPPRSQGLKLGDVAAVAVDRNDRVYLFNRGPDPMVVLDREGNFLASWGRGLFKNPHGLHIGFDDCIYCTDDGDHSVRKFTLDGRLLLTLGTPNSASAFMSGKPFHRCTHTALSPEGDIYVSDGYGNACVHKYSPEGKLLSTWGGPGIGPGEFNFPHNICCDADGMVYVADRENHRIQIFDGGGRYQGQLNHLHRPSALAITPGRCPVCYVGEIGPYLDVNRGWPNLGPRVTVMNHDGKILSRIGIEPAAGVNPGQFLSPHGIAVDSLGDIYVGEVSSRGWQGLFPQTPEPDDLPRMRKLVKVPVAAPVPMGVA